MCAKENTKGNAATVVYPVDTYNYLHLKDQDSSMPETNPLQSDEKLQQLLSDVGSIQSSEALSNWKASFLKVFKHYLDPNCVLNSRDANGRLIKKLQNLAKVSLKVQALSENGHITEEQVTTDGRRALGKWTEEMTLAEKEVARFCPKTSKEIDTVGYDKFELGAVLIQDGFQAYEIMLTNRDFIQELSNGPLQGILDKNQLSIIDFYSNEMQAFVDIMSDLGLLKFMTKCVAVYQDEPRPNSAQEKDVLSEPDVEEVSVDKKDGKGSDSLGLKSKGSKTKHAGKAGKMGRNARSGHKGQPGGQSLPPTPAEEDQVEPPPQEGDGSEGTKIIYFDPKTGNIGLMLREKCMVSELMFAPGEKGVPENTGVINSKQEKENIVWLLKKLEKKKPKEGAWLEEIKKEKAKKAKEGKMKKPSVRVTKELTPGSPTRAVPKRRVRKLTSAKEAGPKPEGFNNPLEAGNSPKKNKSGVQDYDGLYKKVAPKPDNGGWNKVEAEQANG